MHTHSVSLSHPVQTVEVQPIAPIQLALLMCMYVLGALCTYVCALSVGVGACVCVRACVCACVRACVCVSYTYIAKSITNN